MIDILISKELAKQFAYECFDVIIRDIKANEEKEQNNKDTEDTTQSDLKAS